MNWSTLLSVLALTLLDLLQKLISGQLKTKDDVAQGLAKAAVDVGLQAEDLARYVTDEGSRRIEEADALARTAIYGADK